MGSAENCGNSTRQELYTGITAWRQGLCSDFERTRDRLRLLGRHLRRLWTGFVGLASVIAEAAGLSRSSGDGARCAECALGALNCCRSLQRRLVRCGEKSAAITGRIVNKLPLVV